MAVPLPALPTTTQPAHLVGPRFREAARLQPGQIVRVRSRQYLVEDLALLKQHGDATFLPLSCVDDDRIVVRWGETVGHDP